MKSLSQKQKESKEPKEKLYKMKHEKTGVVADVHPKERLNYFKAGYMPIDPGDA